MPDPLALVVAIAGFALVIVAGARLGAGSSLSLGGLVAAHGVDDWPRGVQEADVPRFHVAHADALRPGSPAGNPDTPEIVEVYRRRTGRE